MYNLVRRQAEVEILPLAAAEKLGVITYSPLGGGLLTGKYGMVQVAPRGTHSPICLDLSAV
jgi:aryl-alcohol dehydrogenase-like predicted oxidoreductase